MLPKALLNVVFLSLFSLIIVACDSNPRNGSLEVRKDLTLQNITLNLPDVSDEFDSQNFGPYSATVETSVDTVSVTVGELNEENGGVEILVFKRAIATRSVPNGRIDEVLAQPGDTLSFSLSEGNNVIVVRVRTTDEEQRLDYSFNVRRISQNADLASLRFTAIRNQNVDFVTPSAFDRDETAYQLEVPYEMCSVLMNATVAERNAILALNGEEVRSGQNLYLDLDVGDNIHELQVTPENGSEPKTYSLTLTRAEPTQEQIDENFRLTSLALQDVKFEGINHNGRDFNCAFNSYSAVVGAQQAAINVSATAAIEGRAVRVGLATLTQTDGTVGREIGELTEILPGEQVEIPIASGDENFIVISLADNDDGDPIVHYVVEVERSLNEFVQVDTGAELQQALVDAQPGQEVIITDRFLEVSASAAVSASGKEGTVFLASASGTEDEPIVLRSEAFAVLSAQGEEEATILEVTGDHWLIRDLRIDGGTSGLVINGGDRNNIQNVLIENTSGPGIHIRNGANTNAFARLVVNDIDDDAIVVGSDASNWNTAPVTGPDEPINTANTFGNVIVGPSISGYLFKIEEGAENTRLLNSLLIADDSYPLPITNSLVDIQGSNSLLSLLAVEYSGTDALTSAVSVSDADEDWLTEPWGEDNRVSASSFDFSGLLDSFIVSTSPTVENFFVAQNERLDGVDVAYDGMAIETQDIDRPYQIQWFDADNYDADTDTIAEHTYCLGRGRIDFVFQDGLNVSSGEFDGIVADTCDATDTNQQWRFTLRDTGLIEIRSVSDGAWLAPLYQGTMAVAGEDALTLFANEAVSENPDRYLRWTLNATADGRIFITNGFADGHAVSMRASRSLLYDQRALADYFVNGFMGFGTPYIGNPAQEFTLIPVE